MEAKDNDGRTPMHVAAEYGRTEVLQHLLNLGARAHPQDRCGRTPLYLAQLCMRLDAVTILSAQDLAQEGASSAVSRGNRTMAAKITCC